MSNRQPDPKPYPPVLKLAAFIIVIAGVMYASSIIIPVLLALFVSIICAQPVLWLQKKKIPQSIAIILVFLAITLAFIGIGQLIGNSINSFSGDAPRYEAGIRAMLNSVLDFMNQNGLNISRDQVTNTVDPSRVMGITAGILSELSALMGNGALVFFLSLFMLMELDSYPIKLKAVNREATTSLAYLSRIGQSVRSYLSIKTVVSILTGVLIWVWLLIVGVDYAILWGLIAFLLNYIPNIGSIIAGIPAILFALVQLGVGGAVWTIAGFGAVNMVMGNIVEPRIMGRGLGLSTLVVFLSLLFWGFVLGTVGMFLSVPLTMTIKIMLEQKEETKWIAILLGTQEEAQRVLEGEG